MDDIKSWIIAMAKEHPYWSIKVHGNLSVMGRLLIVFQPNFVIRTKHKSLFDSFKDQFGYDILPISGDDILKKVYVPARQCGKSITSEMICNVLKEAIVDNVDRDEFIDAITEPFNWYYEDKSKSDIIDEIKNGGCFLSSVVIFDYTAFERYTNEISANIRKVEESERYKETFTEPELRKKIKYSKNPLERQMYEKMLAERTTNTRHRSPTKKKKKRK